MSRMNAPAYCSTKPAAPPMPHAPLRSPTPAVSDHDLDEDEAAGFLLGDVGVEAAAVARRDERRVAAIVYISFGKQSASKITLFALKNCCPLMDALISFRPPLCRRASLSDRIRRVHRENIVSRLLASDREIQLRHRAAAAYTSSSKLDPMSSKGTAASRAEREAKVRALWKRRELAPWAAALEAAPARAARPSAVPRLAANPELDRFFYEELPKQLTSLSALTAEQLARVVEWKLARGTWRPRLLDFAKAAKQADVAAAAGAAAKALAGSRGKGGESDLGAAVDALSQLRGVGPATATALLSAADASIPFLSDEAGIAVLGAREYSKPAALRVTRALRERAEELNEQERGGEGQQWTASKVERALWSASRAEEEEDKKGGQEEKAEKGKKKRKLG